MPDPIECEGILRQVLLMGKRGKVVLLSVDPAVDVSARQCEPPGGRRPSGCEQGSEESSAAPLLTNGGELLVVGGCFGSTLQRLDLYNVHNDSWKSFNTGIKRGVPSTVLLPDGNVLILSGENYLIDQIRCKHRDASADPRYPQIFNPETHEIFTETSREDTFRGYHNFAGLLKDGSIILGGGFNQYGDVGCENQNVRLFYPSYLSLGDRPIIQSTYPHSGSEEVVIRCCQESFVITYTGPQLHASRPVALLAVQAFTHSYGQNQRYVQLPVLLRSTAENCSDGCSITVSVPTSPQLLTGHYHLFLLSADGVPSVSTHVSVKSSKSNDGSSKRGFSVSGVMIYGILAAASMIITVLAAVVGWKYLMTPIHHERLSLLFSINMISTGKDL